MERALLVTIKLQTEKDEWPLEDAAAELEELAVSACVEISDNIAAVCSRPTSDLLIGKGKAEELSFICAQENINTVIFSHDLSGTQQRNLEEVIGKKTIDRTQLILDIFARHAKSPEGKLQVELAQLEYLLPRLTGKGIMLSRLGGGIGTRGPGEQKLEVDRRKIRKKIDGLKSDLIQVMQHRKTIRKKRLDNQIPSVALVGYTSAGKSTLLNALTGSHQPVHKSLFTTLDPLSRSLKILNGEKIVISDTVGFLHKLPHHLVEAFKATLEEAIESDLLIHVLDVSHEKVYEHAQAVKDVLKEIGAQDKTVITALNKIDLVDEEFMLNRLIQEFPNAVPISAKLSKNLDKLMNKIQENFQSKMSKVQLNIPMDRMDLLGILYKEGKVESVEYLTDRIKIEANLPELIIHKYLKNMVIRSNC